MKKRWLAITVAAAMTFSMAMPMTAMADDAGNVAILEENSANETQDIQGISEAGTEEGKQETGISSGDPKGNSIDESQAGTTEDIEDNANSIDESQAETTENNEDIAIASETPANVEDNNSLNVEASVNAISNSLNTEKRLDATLSDDQKTISTAIYGADETASALQVAVWSEKNGQDDLTWSDAVKSDDGSWKVDISVKGHKSAGMYFIHAYQTVDGKKQFVSGGTVTIDKAKASVGVDEESKDDTNGAFKVVISDLYVPAGIKNIRAAVWGEKNGQNDIVWYTPQKEGDNYVINVEAGAHGYETGQYNIHCYITDENDIESFAGGTSTNVEYKKALNAEVAENEKTISADAVGVSGATAVSFAVWSEKGGQDDLTWVSGVKQSNGRWTANISVKGHKNTGKYLIHCYATVNNKQVYFDGTTVEITKPTANVGVDESSIDSEKGKFRVRISDINVPAGMKSISVAVWGEVNGQNDLVWYNAAKDGDDYVVDVAASRHKFETGKYLIHCYITDNNDILSYAGGTEQNVSIKDGFAVVVDADQMNATIGYVGSGGANLRAAVWSEDGGQNDLRWYSLTNEGGNSMVTVPIKNHATSGKHFVHVYNGDKFVTGGTFNIDPVKASAVKASNINGNSGTFRLTVSGVESASGVQKVNVAVWTGSGQSKIHWYTAKKDSDGTYYVDANVANHKYAFGTYTTHVYVYGNNGVGNFCCGTSTNIVADRYVYAESTGTYTERVWIVNPGENVSSVAFPTWSATNGQDDVQWYSGTKSGNAWYADVKSANHKHGGTFITHCYVTNNAGTQTYAGGTTYNLSYMSPNSNQAMFDRAQGFSSDTNYLILVNRALHRVAIYQGSQGDWTEIKYWPCVVGKASTPTPAGTFKIKGRFNWFGTDHKCWWATQIEGYYYFHTVLYYWDDAPRRVLDGTMDAAASAGCIRLEEPNAYFIYTQIPRGTTVNIYN